MSNAAEPVALVPHPPLEGLPFSTPRKAGEQSYDKPARQITRHVGARSHHGTIGFTVNDVGHQAGVRDPEAGSWWD